MKLKRNHLLIAAALIIGAVYFSRGRGRYVGGVSASGRTSALPGGYRSEAPNNPYTGN